MCKFCDALNDGTKDPDTGESITNEFNEFLKDTAFDAMITRCVSRQNFSGGIAAAALASVMNDQTALHKQHDGLRETIFPVMQKIAPHLEGFTSTDVLGLVLVLLNGVMQTSRQNATQFEEMVNQAPPEFRDRIRQDFWVDESDLQGNLTLGFSRIRDAIDAKDMSCLIAQAAGFLGAILLGFNALEADENAVDTLMTKLRRSRAQEFAEIQADRQTVDDIDNLIADLKKQAGEGPSSE